MPEETSNWSRFNVYLLSRNTDNKIQEKYKTRLLNFKPTKSSKAEKKGKQKRAKFDSGNNRMKAASDMSKYLPAIVLWTARINMFVLIYMYHSYVSLIHLAWLLLSFLLSMHTTFLFSIYAMIPLLSWEFVFIYGSRIPIV